MSESAWIQTFSKKKFYPLNPNPDDIVIEDIAHALSNLCRFAGHTRQFYSVAQHSVLVSLHCHPDNALAGLLHDASEAYLLDMPRPLKRHSSFQFYNDAETLLMNAISWKFQCNLFERHIHRADMRVFAAECRDLMSPLHPEFDIGEYQPIEQVIIPLEPTAARRLFLHRFNELTQ